MPCVTHWNIQQKKKAAVQTPQYQSYQTFFSSYSRITGESWAAYTARVSVPYVPPEGTQPIPYELPPESEPALYEPPLESRPTKMPVCS